MATRLLELVATGNRIDIAGAGHMCPVTAGGRFAERVLARVAAN
jgi:hypothetical protein